MGFDIYGVNPILKEGSVMPTYPDHPRYEWSDDLPKHENEKLESEWYESYWNDPKIQKLREQYFEDFEKIKEENVGVYFRANVWFWRPIALFLQEHMDFLNEEDIEGLADNSGYIINADKAHMIGHRIQDLNSINAIDEWIRNKKIAIVMLPKEDCTICEATGVRTDTPLFDYLEPFTKNGIEGVKCNGCNGEGTRDPWEANYPYDKEIILEFGKFAIDSGGFQIS